MYKEKTFVSKRVEQMERNVNPFSNTKPLRMCFNQLAEAKELFSVRINQIVLDVEKAVNAAIVNSVRENLRNRKEKAIEKAQDCF